MNDTKRLQYVELVLRPCGLTYGESPCEAELGVTGEFKCYNSPRTCQDPANYTPGDEQILRFAEPTADLPIDIDAIPCLTSLSRRPQQIDPGESIGTRESVSVTFCNFKHNGAGLDRYIYDRGFNTYNRGTFWGKFFSWWGNLQGYEIRTVDGYEGQDIDDMERRYYVVEEHSGPDSGGRVSITMKDVIKLLDGDKAQAPLPSPGVLATGIDEDDTSFSLSPAGIGNDYYPSSGIASIGDEIVSYTRSGDAITLTGRGLLFSDADSHDAGETFQLPLRYDSENPAYIINDLLVNYTDTPTDYLNFSVWEDEVNTYIGRLFTSDIMRPTPVKTLLNELIREVGLLFYTNLTAKKIEIKAMRQFVPTVSVNDDVIIAGTISSKTLLDKRVSDVWTYYGKRNPLEKQDELKNYAAVYASVTQNPVVALENLPRAIREIHSRWITVFNQPAAQAINTSILARYEMAPRQVSFRIPPQIPVVEGQGINVQSRIFEDAQGDLLDPISCQVLSVDRQPGFFSVMAEEVRYTQIPVDNVRIINISEDVFTINIRTVHDSIYTPAESGDTVRLIIAPGIKIGSVSTAIFALNIGDWPDGVIIEVYGSATSRIQGAGGAGGYGNGNGGAGGGAIYSDHPFSIHGDLEIWGGGGGGGGIFQGSPSPIYGGGGAGYIPGEGATTEAGFRNGGGPGQNGISSAGAGGSAGPAILGYSYATIADSPDIRGTTIG